MNLRKRNYTLDIFKALAAFLVVFIHAQFPGTFGMVVSSIAQSGVLLFFMISGYYIYNANAKKIVKSIRHILFLIFITYLLNIIRILIATNFNPLQTFRKLISIKHILQFLFLNISAVSGVMWFLLALLYCYIIYFILNRFNLKKILYIIMPILLAVNLLAGDILVHIGITNFSGYVRNFLVTGIPFFALGNFIHNKQEKIENLFFFRKGYLFSITFLGLILSIAESLFTNGRQYSIGNVILAAGVFLFSIYNPEIHNKPLEFIGGKCCFWIYILHPIMIHIWKTIPFSMNDNTLFLWITPLGILVLTVTASVIIELIKQKVKSSKAKS